MPKVLNPQRKLPRPDDPERAQAIVDGFRAGASHRNIAAKAGIARITLQHWLRDGQRELVEYQTGQTAELGSYGQLVRQIETSYGAFEDIQLQHLNHGKESGGRGWIPALAHLRSVNPEWSETQRVESTVDVSVTHRLELPGVAERALLEIVQAQLLEEQKLLTLPEATTDTD